MNETKPSPLTVPRPGHRDCYLFVNGICTDPDNASDWDYLASLYVQANGLGGAVSYMYKCLPLTRWVWQWYRVRQCAKILREIQNATDFKGDAVNWRIVAAGHSNGCAIIASALGKFPDLKVDEVHLAAAAADADFDRNGLNAAFDRGQIGKLFLYCSKSDTALKIARVSEFIAAKYPLLKLFEYGDLGLEGPKNQNAPAHAQTEVVWCDGYGHGDYFGSHFDTTMSSITGSIRQ